MEVSLTELRQRLFELADRVAETGEAIVIDRRGVRLRITRDPPAKPRVSILARLKARRQALELEPDPPLDPHFSPSEWSPGKFDARDKAMTNRNSQGKSVKARTRTVTSKIRAP